MTQFERTHSLEESSVDRAAEVLTMIRKCLEKMKNELQGRQIVLFGSRALGCAGPRSDFDIGVIGKQPLPLDLFYRVEDNLEALPTLYSIDWVDLNRVSSDFRKRALAQARLIYG